MPRKTNTQVTRSADIPILDEEDEAGYDSWKIRVKKWSKVTKEKKSNQGNLLFLTLDPKGKAFMVAQHISEELLETTQGVQALLDELDKLFIPDKLRHRVDLYDKYGDLRRQDDESVIDHIQEFNKTFLEFRKLSITLPYDDTFVALDLLKSCKLQEEDKKLVLAQMVEPPSSADLISILKRIFSRSVKEKQQTAARQVASDVFVTKSNSEKMTDANNTGNYDTENTNTTLYTRDNRKGYRQARPSYATRGRSGKRNNSWNRNSEGPKTNIKGLDGQPRTCSICDSIYHFFKNCPEVKKQKRDYDNRNRYGNQEVNLSFLSFVGCASSNDEKLQKLLDDSQGYALLDSGCSNTVAGEDWFSKYVENLSTSDKLKIKVEASSESFTFGDGNTHKAKRRITFPCWVGGKTANITTDIVECKIPLLLSRRSMSKVGMIIDFSKHIATVQERAIKLKVTHSGHYALPISL